MSSSVATSSSILMTSSATHLESDIVIPRDTLSTGLKMLFHDLVLIQSLYPDLRYLQNELIELILDYTVADSVMTVTWLSSTYDSYDYKISCRAKICSSEIEIRRHCLALLNESQQHWRLGVSRTFQSEVAGLYDWHLNPKEKRNREPPKMLQNEFETTPLPTDLVFASKQQQSAYTLYDIYQRVLKAGHNPQHILFHSDDLLYNRLAVYSSLLFGDIYEVLRGIQFIRSSRHQGDGDEVSTKFNTIVSEIDPITGRLITKEITGELNELSLVSKYPNPFTPNLVLPAFLTMIQQEKNESTSAKEEEEEED